MSVIDPSNIATLTVLEPLVFSKNFVPAVILQNNTTTLTFTLTNNNSSTINLGTNPAFTDSFPNIPVQMVVADPPNATTTCNATLRNLADNASSVAGDSGIRIEGGSVPANSSCTVQIDVTASNIGIYNNTSSTLSTSIGSVLASSAALTVTATLVDYGDTPADGLPAPNGAVNITAYGTPSHTIVADLHIGNTPPDADASHQASSDASGDGADDNDITLPTLYQGGTTTIDVPVNQGSANAAYLQAWIDFDGDGDFLDAGEQIATDLQYAGGVSGTISLNVTVPITAITTQTYARFRWSTTQNLDSTTVASDGEVEDYAINIAIVDRCKQ